MRESFKTQYLRLISGFVTGLGDRELSGIPAIHIPVIGNLYEKAPVKIAFFGKETNGWGAMDQLIAEHKKSPEDAYAGLTDIDPANYLQWRNNFGTSFWDYITLFLKTLYSLDNAVFDGPEGAALLASFIWGNTNAVERFEVTAQGTGAKYEDWEPVKNASRIFDTPRYVLDICRPDLLIVLNWDENESWLSGGEKITAEEIGDHHCYYPLPQTHVYWTAHPRWLAQNTGFTESVRLITEDLQKRGFTFPAGFSIKE
jgi:hypothetical protein